MSSMEQQNPPRSRDNDGLHKRRGIWYYSLTVAGEREFHSTRTHNYTEARKIRMAAIAAYVDNRLPGPTAEWPFKKLLEKVKEDRKLHLSENSIRIDRERSGPLEKFFGLRRVAEIDNNAIRDFQRARQKKVSAKTINLECGLLSAVLKDAGIWKRLKEDYKPLKCNRRGPGKALEPEEEAVLFDTARSEPRWDAAFLAALLASNTTMRGFELKNLHIWNLDLTNGDLIIQKSKTDAGRRVIKLNAPAVWAAKKLLNRANALGSVKDEHFLFPAFNYRRTKTGEPSSGTGYNPKKPQRSWRSAWRSLRSEAGKRAGQLAYDAAVNEGAGPEAAEEKRRKALERFEGLRFHDLRHTAITKMAESQESDRVIMDLAGHVSKEMLKHYSHIRDRAKQRAVEAMATYDPEQRAPESMPVSTRVQ